MELNLITIGVLLAVLIVGYLIGLLETSIKASRKGKKSAAAEPIPSTDGDTTILRLSADAARQLHLELDGSRADTAALTPEQRRRLITLLTRMRPWLESGATEPAPRPAPPRTPGAAAAASIAPAAAVTKPTADEKAEEETPIATASIVAQIDKILQARLAGTSLAERGIRLQELPDGGAAVYVGLQRYGGVDEIPDPHIQAVIREAIAAWEQGVTPGS